MTAHDQPITYHPVEYLPRLVTHVEFQGFQHLPGRSQELAGWCGGAIVTEGDRTAVSLDEVLAYLGDWILSDGERFWVEPADGAGGSFVQRYWPKGVDPGWEWRCYRNGEEPS